MYAPGGFGCVCACFRFSGSARHPSSSASRRRLLGSGGFQPRRPNPPAGQNHPSRPNQLQQTKEAQQTKNTQQTIKHTPLGGRKRCPIWCPTFFNPIDQQKTTADQNNPAEHHSEYTFGGTKLSRNFYRAFSQPCPGYELATGLAHSQTKKQPRETKATAPGNQNSPSRPQTAQQTKKQPLRPKKARRQKKTQQTTIQNTPLEAQNSREIFTVRFPALPTKKQPLRPKKPQQTKENPSRPRKTAPQTPPERPPERLPKRGILDRRGRHPRPLRMASSTAEDAILNHRGRHPRRGSGAILDRRGDPPEDAILNR